MGSIEFVSITIVKGRRTDEKGLWVVFVSIREVLKLLNADCISCGIKLTDKRQSLIELSLTHNSDYCVAW